MIPRRILESASIKELYRFMIENRLSRRALFGIVSRRLRQELVVKNEAGRPRRVQELKHAYMMALFHGFDRAMTRGYVSKSVTQRLLETVLDHVIADEKHPAEPGRASSAPRREPDRQLQHFVHGLLRRVRRDAPADLSFDIFDRIVSEKRALWDSHLTIVSGGEPFLWRDGERGLLDLVEKHPTEFFMVYTNGTLITDDLAKRMADLGNISPAVSLEGLERETDSRRGAGVFRKMLDAFENLRRRGVPFGVSVTPTSENWDLVTSDRFIDFCFEEQGAVYGWCFQYMPIGRAPDTGLVVSPENRLEMLRRTHHIVRDKKVLFADFWNSGITSYGCISAGRAGGQFYIDWNGDVMPCVFVPYAIDNIYSVYERGDNLETLRDAPFFRKIRSWQDEYGFARPAGEVRNWLCPCPIRDDFAYLREAVLETKARPINEAAAQALEDPGFRKWMVEYAGEYRRLSEPVWGGEFAETPPAEPRGLLDTESNTR